MENKTTNSMVHHHPNGDTCHFANVMATFLQYCKDCDCLHIAISLRNTETKVSMFVTNLTQENTEKLIKLLQDNLTYYNDKAKEDKIIKAIKEGKQEIVINQVNLII